MTENPFTKQFFNLTKQGEIYQTDKILDEHLRTEAAELDAAAERQRYTKTLDQFNMLDKNAQIKFISQGGVIC